MCNCRLLLLLPSVRAWVCMFFYAAVKTAVPVHIAAALPLLLHRFACRRANKTRSEALAYYNMGVLHDNDKEHDKANRSLSLSCSPSLLWVVCIHAHCVYHKMASVWAEAC